MHSQGADNKNRLRADPIKSIFSVGCCHLMSLSLPHRSLSRVSTPRLVLPIAVTVSEEGRRMWETETRWSRLCWKMPALLSLKAPSAALLRARCAIAHNSDAKHVCRLHPKQLTSKSSHCWLHSTAQASRATIDLNPRYFC